MTAAAWLDNRGDVDEALLADLPAECEVLDRLVAGIDEARWDAPTPAVGWTVADQIHHLTVSDRLGIASLRGDAIPRMESDPVIAPLSSRPSGVEILAGWRAARAEFVALAAATDSRATVGWVASTMSARTLVTTRLTECWAHGLDCFAALGVAPVDSARLRHVVHQSFRMLPYSFSVAGVAPSSPIEGLALDLTGPDGDSWWFGPDHPTAVVRGPAGDWCRVAVHRLDRSDTELATDGALAEATLEVVRTYV